MRLFLYCTYVPASEFVEVAVEAERLGFDGISLPDHLVYPVNHTSPYPYTIDGTTPWSETMDWPDPFATLGAIASRTERLELLTGVLVLPLRHPLAVAKATATIDVISGGRMNLGIGVGWLREEYEALGLDWSKRGAMTNESIEVLRRAWTGERVEHHGDHFDFDQLTVRPPAKHHIPIYVGGKSRAAIRRAGTLGDGFLPPIGAGSDLSETKQLIEEVNEVRRTAGRAAEPFDVMASATVSRSAEELGEVEEIGITSVRVDPFALYVQKYGGLTLDQRLEAVGRYAEDVIAPLRSDARRNG